MLHKQTRTIRYVRTSVLIIASALVWCTVACGVYAAAGGNDAIVTLHYKRGIHFYKLAQYNVAAKELERVLELDPTHRGAQKYLTVIQKKQHEAVVKQLYQEAKKHYRARDYESAIKDYEEVLQLVPNDEYSRYHLTLVRDKYEKMQKRQALRRKKNIASLERTVIRKKKESARSVSRAMKQEQLNSSSVALTRLSRAPLPSGRQESVPQAVTAEELSGVVEPTQEYESMLSEAVEERVQEQAQPTDDAETMEQAEQEAPPVVVKEARVKKEETSIQPFPHRPAPSAPSISAERLHTILQQPVSLDIEHGRVSAVMKELQRIFHIPITLSEKAAQTHETITIRIEMIPLREALSRMLLSVHACYRIEGAAIVVATQEECGA